MKTEPVFFEGGVFEDSRGKMTFVNDFLMSEVKRMYFIEPVNSAVIRAWQGHKREQKWFYVLSGSFEVKLIKPDNWRRPSLDLPIYTYILNADQNKVLYIPGGYINGFRALSSYSKLQVFSDFEIKDAAADDFRFDSDYWPCW